jgi:hypothetical protein
MDTPDIAGGEDVEAPAWAHMVGVRVAHAAPFEDGKRLMTNGEVTARTRAS